MSMAFSTWLNLFRWLAALAVLITHTEHVLLADILDIPRSEREYVHYAYVFLGGFGFQAVLIFFVISGFLVGGALWNELKEKRTVDLFSYFVKRMVRLWTVVIPTLFLVLLLDSISIFVFDGLRNGVFYSDIFSRLSFGSFLCNAVFLQTAACQQYGDNGALWSLYNEFWYYCIWPPMLLAILPILSVNKRVFCAIGAIAGLLLLNHAQAFAGFASGMFIWLMGVLVSALDKPFI